MRYVKIRKTNLKKMSAKNYGALLSLESGKAVAKVLKETATFIFAIAMVKEGESLDESLYESAIKESDVSDDSNFSFLVRPKRKKYDVDGQETGDLENDLRGDGRPYWAPKFGVKGYV